MPLVTINLRKGRSLEAKAAISDSIQAALVGTLGVPDADRFALLREYESQDFIHTPAYLDMKYTGDLLMLEILFIEGRTDDTKKALIRDINERLVKTGFVRADDVFIAISEVGRANISFGKGLAQRAT
jgi:phenylpyruvate tautomerase PptA (4-oxalocrotonate tautomerase family)